MSPHAHEEEIPGHVLVLVLEHSEYFFPAEHEPVKNEDHELEATAEMQTETSPVAEGGIVLPDLVVALDHRQEVVHEGELVAPVRAVVVPAVVLVGDAQVGHAAEDEREGHFGQCRSREDVLFVQEAFV